MEEKELGGSEPKTPATGSTADGASESAGQGRGRPRRRVEGVVLTEPNGDLRLFCLCLPPEPPYVPLGTAAETLKTAGFADGDEIAAVTLADLDSLISDLRSARKREAALYALIKEEMHPDYCSSSCGLLGLDPAKCDCFKAEAAVLMGAAAEPPSDSSAALREARRLLGEALKEFLWGGSRKAREFAERIETFLDKPAAGPPDSVSQRDPNRRSDRT